MLWVGMLARDTGTPASDRLGIRDEVVALEFDLAVSLRLLRFDNERAEAQAKRIAYECRRMFFGGEDVLDANVIDDPHADKHTLRW